MCIKFSNVIKIHFAVLSILCFSIVSNGRQVYVSSSLGNDSNDGTIEKPYKSIKYALTKADTLFLLAGDTFYETIRTNRKYIYRYGQGNNPILSGYKRLTKPEWKHVTDDIWSIDLSGDYFVGNNIVGATFLNNIGCIHDLKNDSIHGRRVRYYDNMKKDWDFWQTERFDANVPASEFSVLYMKCPMDPNGMSLEFSTGQLAVEISNSELKGINIEGFGFGVSAGTKVKISHCHIDAIGGMLFRGYGWFESYGNGIEFFVSKDIRDCVVENCVISRTYDSGITVQVSKAYDYSPENIQIRNNLLVSCGQGWEDYIMNSDPEIRFINCTFSNNTIVNSGVSGFGYRDNKVLCNVIGYNTHGIKGMIIDSNVFIGGNFYSSPPYKGEYKSNIWKNNKCYISVGDYYFTSNAQDYIYVEADKVLLNENYNKYRVVTGDETTRFIIKNSKRIKKLQRRAILNYTNKHRNIASKDLKHYL